MTTHTTTPRIYVACLAAYNAGQLHGEWIDADQSADQLHEAIQAMLSRSPEQGAEEWAIHDYEGFGPVKLSEWESMDTVSGLARAIEEHGTVFAEFYHHCDGGDDVEDAVRAFGENYQGAFKSLAEYAEDWCEQSGSLPADLPDFIRWHIDWEGVAHDWEVGGDIFTIQDDQGMVHVFSNH